jgi:hypothetical protein
MSLFVAVVTTIHYFICRNNPSIGGWVDGSCCICKVCDVNALLVVLDVYLAHASHCHDLIHHLLTITIIMILIFVVIISILPCLEK